MEEFLKLLYTYKLGIFVFTLFIIAIVGLVVLIMKSKKTGIRILFGVAVIIIAFAVLTFSIAAMNSKYSLSDSKNGIWEALDFSISLLGLLLTAGAAFATVAAIISYISVNDKLKSANKDLVKAKRIVQETKKLKQEQDKLRKGIENLKKYESLVVESKTTTNNDELFEQAEELKEEPNLPFYGRLLVNAILNDKKAKIILDKAKKAKEEKKEEAENIWEEVYYLYQKSSDYWYLIYLNDNHEIRLTNYTASLFNCAYALGNSGEKNYDKAIDLYKKVIYIYQNNNWDKNEIFRSALNNLGVSKIQKARVVDSDKIRLELLKKSATLFKKTIIIDNNYLNSYKGLKAIIKQATDFFKEKKDLLKEFLEYFQSEINEIKHLERNEECEKAFKGIEKLLNEKLEDLNSN